MGLWMGRRCKGRGFWLLSYDDGSWEDGSELVFTSSAVVSFTYLTKTVLETP